MNGPARPSLPRRLSTPKPWRPLTNPEWAALAPFVARHTAGRPIQDARLPGRTARWADLPARFGKPDTVSRQFRRWATAGLWPRLLLATADPTQPGHATLRRLESWICRAYRRAWRLLGIPGTFLARRLGLLSALRAPPNLLPDPDLSEDVQALSFTMAKPLKEGRLHDIPAGFFARCAELFRIAAGRTRIPWYLAPP